MSSLSAVAVFWWSPSSVSCLGGGALSASHPSTYVSFLKKLDSISPDFVSNIVPWCIDLTVDEGGSAEPTRDKNIIGMYRRRGAPSYVTPVGSSS